MFLVMVAKGTRWPKKDWAHFMLGNPHIGGCEGQSEHHESGWERKRGDLHGSQAEDPWGQTRAMKEGPLEEGEGQPTAFGA